MSSPFPYIKMFNGRPEDLYSDANFLTDSIELRSNSMASTLAEGFSLSIVSLTSLPAAVFLTPIITWTPRLARTRVVSVPIPLDAPVNKRLHFKNYLSYSQLQEFNVASIYNQAEYKQIIKQINPDHANRMSANFDILTLTLISALTRDHSFTPTNRAVMHKLCPVKVYGLLHD